MPDHDHDNDLAIFARIATDAQRTYDAARRRFCELATLEANQAGVRVFEVAYGSTVPEYRVYAMLGSVDSPQRITSVGFGATAHAALDACLEDMARQVRARREAV